MFHVCGPNPSTSSENLTLQAHFRPWNRPEKPAGGPAPVVRLLVSIRTSCALPYEVLGRLLWYQRHRVAKLFEAVGMVTLNACSILLVKVVRSQVGGGFLGT